MRKRILSIDEFVNMCQSKNIQKFSSRETGYELALQIPSILDFSETDDPDHEGLLRVKFRILHTGRVYNGFVIPKNSVEKAKKSAHNRPILAHIHKPDGSDEWDFMEHDAIINYDEDGNETIEYLEKQVGTITNDETWYEYDDASQKEFWCAYGVIPREYTKAAEILERKNGSKVSSELYIRSMSWNIEENVPQFDDWYLSGVTLLGSFSDGTPVGEGIKGSRADISDFSVRNNSILNSFVGNEQLVNVIKELNANLKSLQESNVVDIGKKGGKEGQMDKFKELLKQYNKSESDIDFEYKDLTDEELEAKFADVFGSGKKDGNVQDVQDMPKNNNRGNADAAKIDQYSVKFIDGAVKTFSVTLSDIDNAMYNLVNSTYGEKDGAWYFCDIYPDESKVVYHDAFSKNAYRESYVRDGDNLSLSGDRVKVSREWITEAERECLDKMKVDFAEIRSELEAFKKNEILNSKKYESIRDTDEVKELLDEKNKEAFSAMTADELSNKMNEIIVNCVTSGKFNFAQANVDNGSSYVPLPFNKNDKGSKSPYNDLFKKFKK